MLSFLEKREGKMEASMLQKAEGFKYLYKEQFTEFGKAHGEERQGARDG